MKLAGIEQTKRFLRYDDADNDDVISEALDDASDAVLQYLKDPTLFRDSDGEPIADSDGVALEVPGGIRRATMLLAGILLRDPAGVESQTWEQGYLPRVVTSLLYPFRDPTLQ